MEGVGVEVDDRVGVSESDGVKDSVGEIVEVREYVGV